MVSVIIPTYNREATILRSVMSVLNQTYKDIECIIVDDASSDNTQKIVESISDKRIRYERLEKNSGACIARNRGIDLAMGEYIAFQDSDDEWIPDKLTIQINKMIETGADVCFCKKVKTSTSGDYSYETLLDLEEGFIPPSKLYKRSRVSTQTIFAKSKTFREFQFDEKVKKAQDYEWTIRACEKYKFYFIDQALVIQYIQKDSITAAGKKNITIEKEMNEYFLDKFSDRFKTDPDLYVALLRREVSCKLSCHEDVTKIYLKLFEITKSPMELARCLAAKLGLSRIVQHYRARNINRIIKENR